MVRSLIEFEESHDTSWMEDLNSVRWHFVAYEIEAEVDVLEEERDGEETIKELSWGIIFDHLHPDLLLFAVSTLNEIVRVAEVHVVWPHATELVAMLAFLTFVQWLKMLIK